MIKVQDDLSFQMDTMSIYIKKNWPKAREEKEMSLERFTALVYEKSRTKKKVKKE